MPPTLMIPKFIGTISLGLLTGVSYTLTTTLYPSLLLLPSATDASRTFSRIHNTSQIHSVVLGGLSVVTLTGAFIFSPSRARHPYLLWTSLFAVLAVGRDVYLLGKSVAIGGPSVLRGGASGVSSVGQMDSGHGSVRHEKTLHDKHQLHSKHEQHAEYSDVNGEMVEKRVREARLTESMKGLFGGLAFALGVVGLWGDGS